MHFLLAHAKNNHFVFICENSTRWRDEEAQVPLSVVPLVPSRPPVSSSEGDRWKTEHFLWGRGLCWSLCWMQARALLGRARAPQPRFPSQPPIQGCSTREVPVGGRKEKEVKHCARARPSGSGVGGHLGWGLQRFYGRPWPDAWRRWNNLRNIPLPSSCFSLNAHV